MSRIWPKRPINSQENSSNAIAPLILSASRACDIPAFTADWLIQRFEAGWLEWRNPFNSKKMLVNLSAVEAIVYWSKYPAALLSRLPHWKRQPAVSYLHYTLNDYSGTGLEPDLPPLTERIDCFKRASDYLGSERIIWRFDPLLASPAYPIEEALERCQRIASQLRGYTRKLVFSFGDIQAYSKVSRRLATKHNGNEHWREYSEDEQQRFARGIREIGTPPDKPTSAAFQLASCAETIDLSTYGIDHNACIDRELLLRLAEPDSPLAGFLHSRAGQRKDAGQRAACRCCPAKDIGNYGSCAYHCQYCYAKA